MPNITVNALRRGGALTAFGQYSFNGPWNPPRVGVPGLSLAGLSGLGAGCPEGSRMVNGECVCYDGRVWMPDNSRCVSPQSPAYTGAMTLEQSKEGHTPDTYSQQELTTRTKQILESLGYQVDCKIDPSWFAGPQGGVPSRICRLNDSPYQFGAYAINLNPFGAVNDYKTWSAAQKIEAATGIPSGSLYRTPETTALLLSTASTGVVSPAQAKVAVESVLKQDARGIPEYGVPPSSPTVNFKSVAVTSTGGTQALSQTQQQYSGPAYNDPTSPYYDPVYAAGGPGWNAPTASGPSPVTNQYYQSPAVAGGGAAGAAGAIGSNDGEGSKWLLPVLAIGAAFMLMKG